jgi:7,8-dihydropterin-6-yl-methyl-4-(beta-D-ribofuranosyl)aminobenzene 5'-phosphate synthase
MNTCTVLLENNNLHFSHAKSGHGLSLYLEIDNLKILFDTGPNPDFIYNANLLKKNLNSVDSVVLSHSHYDHCCGYTEFVNKYRCRELICSDRFFYDKYGLSEGVYYYKGIDFDEKFLNCFVIHTTHVEKTLKLSEHIYIHSNIKNTEDFEPLPNSYFIKESDGYHRDKFLDESVLVLDNKDGLTLIVACSHPGIVSIVKAVSKIHNKKVKTIIGGLHLSKAKKDRIEKTITALENEGVEKVYLGHCTGDKMVDFMKMRNSKIQSFRISTGAVIDL